ncbi:MAG: 4Fe-4S binding protein [Coprococcus sp.]
MLCLLVLIMVGMAVQERFFCRFLCPMGAVFSWLPMLPFFTLKREREQCIKGCSACTKQCPSDIGLPEVGSLNVSGDCFQCQKCIDTCPRAEYSLRIAGYRKVMKLFLLLSEH